ncbi:hypothetical protein GCG54_00010709 [Colletotrichum gloeosporioides]|uniref:Uncharacterized protein n=1 Tax=Colletotrichum gloeosporioides TaxID=474922 RepID=A0A8H4FEZ1_COLGL|nr:uncharacterized protein GCG54_00010709 [Colletotrichum gloeosporioides]KAF3798559.1 hypothetical protein GCG54_00010709 [Colletotrichum gloeosporioides]
MKKQQNMELAFRPKFTTAIQGIDLMSLPTECLCQILDEVVEYREESDTNLRDAVRLMRVCKLFETEVMGAISRTRLLRRMRKNREATILHQKAQPTAGRASADCKLTENGDASAFLARYIYQQPYQHLPWKTNLSSVINSLADKLMKQDGMDPTGKRRFSYVHDLCRYAVHPQPSLANITTRYGIWMLFHPYFQSALFPSKSAITKETIDNLLLVAKIYLKRSDVDNTILSKILTQGPKALSTYQPITIDESSDEAEPKKLTTKKPLLGSLLEAAIRSGNQNLAALLVKYEIDVSRGKSYKAPDGNKKKIKKYYDTYFCRVAFKYGDVETFAVLLECSDGRMLRGEFADLLMQVEPPVRGPVWEWRYLAYGWQHRGVETGLEEAISHGYAHIFGMILDSAHANDRTYWMCRWEKTCGLPWLSAERPYDGRFPIEIAAECGDESKLNSLLVGGSSPYGPSLRCVEAYAKKSDPGLSITHLMPMISAAKNWHIGSALILIKGGFECNQQEWLLVMGTAITSRRDIKGADAFKGEDEERKQTIRQRDVVFWQRLFDAIAMGLHHLEDDCPWCRTFPVYMVSPLGRSVGAARNFIRTALQISGHKQFEARRLDETSVMFTV